MSGIQWHMPWLLLIALQPFLLMLVRYLLGHRRMNAYTTPHLRDWAVLKKRFSLREQLFSRNTAYIIAWLMFAIAAAGPRTIAEAPDTVTSTGTDIMVVLDISRSMHTADLNPSRLRQARNKIVRLVGLLQNERMGVIVFAARPHLYIPITRDKQALDFYLRNIDSLSPPSQGSRPGPALQLAYEELARNRQLTPDRKPVILLMSDGDLASAAGPGTPEPILADNLRSAKVPVFSLGFGTRDGDAVPDYANSWLVQDNKPVISQLNDDFLRSISLLTDGEYFSARRNDAELNQFLDESRQLAATVASNQDTTTVIWNELYSLFLLPGIVLLFISYSPYAVRISGPKLPLATHGLLLFSLAFALTVTSLVPRSAWAGNTSAEQAYRALVNRDYSTAKQHYADMKGFDGRFGEGVVSYRLEDFSRAIRFFSQAVLEGEDDDQRGRALFNLGNSLFQVGNYADAIQSYQDALRYFPGEGPAKHNLAFAQKAHAAVEERQRILARTSRAGRGPRKGRAVEGIELNDSNKVSIDDGPDEDPSTAGQDIDHAALDIPEVLVLKGLDYAARKSGEQALQHESPVSTAQRKVTLNTLNQLHDNQSQMWKRIFELEEGYPAPLDTPDTIPGVSAW